MRELDRQYLETPFYRSRRMTACLEQRGILVSRNRVQRLMRVMGLQAIYRRPRTANRRWECGSIPTCWGRPKSPASTRRGPPTSLTCPWSGDSSIWWWSWTVTAGMFCPGACPTLWRAALRRASDGGAGLRKAGSVQHRSGEPVHQPGVSSLRPPEAWVKISMDEKGRYADNISWSACGTLRSTRRCT